MDITTFYGYKNQFQFYVENNGANPITVRAIDLVNQAALLSNSIFTELENTFPITVIGNGQVEVFANFFSLNPQDQTTDLTYNVTYDIIDMSDFTSVLDTTTFGMTFTFENQSAVDETNHDLLSRLNKYFHQGPGATDTTITSSLFTSTGLPILRFSDPIKYSVFLSTCQPQFAVFNNNSTGQRMICGQFYFNADTNSVEAFFTADEKALVVGLVFNDLIFYYSNPNTIAFQNVNDVFVSQVKDKVDDEGYYQRAKSAEFGSGDATIDVNFATSTTFHGTLSMTSQVVKMLNLQDGQSYRLILKQDSTGSRVVSDWVALDMYGESVSIKWAGGSAPTLTTTADKTDIISCLFAGGILYADINHNF